MISIIVSVYLLIGLVYSFITVRYIDEKIDQYENGEKLDEDDMRRLEETKVIVNTMTGKGFIVFMFILVTLFWLPMQIFDPKKFR
jgi:p-aminobenzoyl-glutamate transporter AbgT